MASDASGGYRPPGEPEPVVAGSPLPLVAGAAQRVANNMKALRKERGLDLADLSVRLEHLGHPIGVNSLSKIELGKRRVVVEDLLALALVLDTSPIRLLLPPCAGRNPIRITNHVRASALQVWRWAVGDWPLRVVWNQESSFRELWFHHRDSTTDLDRMRRFRAENRPYDADDTSIEVLVENRKALREVADAVRTVLHQGVPLSAVKGYLDLIDFTGDAPPADEGGEGSPGAG